MDSCEVLVASTEQAVDATAENTSSKQSPRVDKTPESNTELNHDGRTERNGDMSTAVDSDASCLASTPVVFHRSCHMDSCEVLVASTEQAVDVTAENNSSKQSPRGDGTPESDTEFNHDGRTKKNGDMSTAVDTDASCLASTPDRLPHSECELDSPAAEQVGSVVDLCNNNSDQSESMVLSLAEIANVEIVENADSPTSDSEDDDSDSDSSTSSYVTTSSNDSTDFVIRNKNVDLLEEINALKNSEPLKVKGEILQSELPPVEDLNIVLPDDTVLESVGKVTQMMQDYSIVVQSHPGKPALDIETVLFLSRQMTIGKVEETFGPVPNPYYIIRFNNEEHLLSKGIEVNTEVFYAPHIKDFTSFVFLSALRQIRGSDASWCNDVEPPPACLDYSDDEEEREARKKLRKSKVGETVEMDEEKNENSNGKEARRPVRGVKRGRGRGQGQQDHWHNQSQRVNVRAPDPALEGWHAAVNRMSSHAPPGHAPPSLLNCFQRPPQHGRFDIHPNPNRPPVLPQHPYHPANCSPVMPPYGSNQHFAEQPRMPVEWPWPTHNRPGGFGYRPAPPPPPPPPPS